MSAKRKIKLKKKAYLWLFLLLFAVFLGGCLLAINNVSNNKLNTPNSIFIYNLGNKTIIDKSDKLFNQILNKINKQIADEKNLDLSKSIMNKSEEDKVKLNSYAIELTYNKEQKSKFKNYNDEQINKSYTRILIPLDNDKQADEIFTGSKKLYSDAGLKLTSKSLDFKDIINDVYVDNLLQFKDKLVGDNSAVSNIINYLPGNIYQGGISLLTKEQPYGIILNYSIGDVNEETKKQFSNYWNSNYKKILLNNATALCTLITNVDHVQFNINTDKVQSFIFTRKELEEFYGKDVREYSKNIVQWKQEVLNNTISSEENTNKFYATYKVLKTSQDEQKQEVIGPKVVKLYFGNDTFEFLNPEDRELNNPTPKTVLEELIKGPQSDNLYRTLPEDTKIISVEVKDGVAYVNFDKSIQTNITGNYGSSTASVFLLEAITNTLHANDFGVEKVAILIEGQKQDTFGPLDVKNPVAPDLSLIKE